MASGMHKWLVAAAFALVLVGCGDAGPTPDAKTDAVATDAATDTAAGSDAGGDSLAGQTDAVTGDSGTADCDQPCVDTDGDPCTVALCEAGSCVQRALPDGTSCDDGNPCQTGDVCKDAKCTAGSTGSGTCGCETEADCAGLNDALVCNGSYFCDKSSFPFACKLNPASIPPCEAQTPPSPCVTAVCVEPTAAGTKAQCAWQTVADGTPCDDANPLTSGDICAKGSCVSGAFVGQCQNNADCAAFEDSNLCNGQLFCNKAKGQCQVNPATIVACPTGFDTQCSRNTCQPATGQCKQMAVAQGESCEDGLGCTVDETCDAGVCVAGNNTCACASDADCAGQEDGNLCNGTLFCNLQVGKCQLNPASVVTCGESDDPCQQLVCVPESGACVASAADDGAPCNADNNLCTPQDVCAAGKCTAGANLCSCSNNADCAVFDDADQCNGQLYCNLQTGGCELNPATVVTCDAGEAGDCTTQVCVPLSGECTAVVDNQGGGCDDGDPCTLGDTCQDGACTAGNSVCACQTDADCAAEEDGNFCNGSLFCDKKSGTCKLNPSSIVMCADPTPTDCWTPVCAPATGLCVDTTRTQGVACDDGDPCSVATQCDASGSCQGGLSSCGCATDLDCIGEDDGDACNGVVRCDLKIFPVPQCKLVPPAPCVGSACVVATCDPQSGTCTLTPQANQATCDDGDPCTVASVCGTTGCAGKPLDCDDNEACTLDWCWQGGCQHQALADKLACDDGDLCTVVDYCDAGKCLHVNKTCDDGNGCTTDSCSAGECVFAFATSTCDDGNSCTNDDTCLAGLCVGEAVVCPDPGPCNVAACVDGQCLASPGNDGATCTDGKPCTQSAMCAGGSCVRHETKPCDDGDPCTTDPDCDDAKDGCAFLTAPDGNPAVYWESVVEDGNWWWGLAENPTTGKLAALASGPANDPLLRIWTPGGGAPLDVALSYPGVNVAEALLDDGGSGWLISGYNGGIYSASQQTKPLLMRADASGSLQWVSTSLVPNLSLGQMVHVPLSATGGAQRVMIAGSHAPSGDATQTQMWLGEVDVSGPQGPVLIRSGTCSVTGAPPTTLNLYGEQLVQLTGGDWVVGGWLEANGQQFTTQSPAFCRFDADLKPKGPAVVAENNGNSRQLIARDDGGFWWFDDAERWRAYDASGVLVRQMFLGGWASAAVADGDAAWLAYNNDGSWSVAWKPLTGSGQTVLPVLDGLDGSALDLIRTRTGYALLVTEELNLVLRHFDTGMYATCAANVDCEGSCSTLGACTVGRCIDGSCDTRVLDCDDNNGCTLDSCSATGCQYTTIADSSCDDGQDCTVNDACQDGKCVGISRYGKSSWTAPASEHIVDGVPFGDGLLVVGTRVKDGNTMGFWRLYGPSRTNTQEGELPGVVPLRLARARSGLAGATGYGPGEWVGLVGQAQDGSAQMWFLQPESLALSDGTSLFDANELLDVVQTDSATVQLVRRTAAGWTWLSYTAGSGLSEVYAEALESTVRDGHLLPSGDDWLFVLTSYGQENATIHFVPMTAKGELASPADLQPLSYPGSFEEPLCPYAARAGDGVQVVCSVGQAFYFDTVEGAAVAMPDTLANAYSLPASPLVAATPFALHTLGYDNKSGDWTLYPHDGFFNASTQRVTQVADSAPVLVAGPGGVWFVTETIVGSKREVTLVHTDPWGNATCTASGNCANVQCDDAVVCTVDSCSGGFCSHTPIDPQANCGATGPCQFCTPF